MQLKNTTANPLLCVVSILTRRDGRVQPVLDDVPNAMRTGFQSSPGAMAGCNPRRSVLRLLPPTCFNPHPARWPGATHPEHPADTTVPVSILTRRDGRVQQKCCSFSHNALLVSILTRRDGRVQHASHSSPTFPVSRFQSSPGAMAGCNVFNKPLDDVTDAVSILTRRDGRVQPG